MAQIEENLLTSVPTSNSEMPCHASEIPNLKRIEGQVRGLIRMIDEKRYCMDILTQCRSVHAALEGVEKKIFRKYLDTCVRKALIEKSELKSQQVFDEIVALLSRK